MGGACSLAPLLLAQELEDGGEVLGGVAAGAHDPEDLVGQRAQRDGGPGVGGRVLGQAQVLHGERSKVRRPDSNALAQRWERRQDKNGSAKQTTRVGGGVVEELRWAMTSSPLSCSQDQSDVPFLQ